jgi:hypothetical protein
MGSKVRDGCINSALFRNVMRSASMTSRQLGLWILLRPGGEIYMESCPPYWLNGSDDAINSPVSIRQRAHPNNFTGKSFCS